MSTNGPSPRFSSEAAMPRPQAGVLISLRAIAPALEPHVAGLHAFQAHREQTVDAIGRLLGCAAMDYAKPYGLHSAKLVPNTKTHSAKLVPYSIPYFCHSAKLLSKKKNLLRGNLLF